jgi:hypothetical protein
VEVHDGVVERHRHLVLGLEVHRGREFLVIGHRRQLERAQHRALVGDADAHPLAQATTGEQLAQGLAERVLVDHFAVAHRVGRERHGGGPLSHDRAVDTRLNRRDEAGLNVQADEVLAGTTSEVEGDAQAERGDS